MGKSTNSNITIKIERVKDLLIVFSFFLTILLVSFRTYCPIDNFSIPTDYCNYAICAMLFIIAVLSVKDSKQLLRIHDLSQKLRPIIAVPYIITGIFVLFASLLQPIGSSYKAWAFIMLIAYGSVYYVWAIRGDFERLFLLLSYALLIYSIIIIACCLTEPYVQDVNKNYYYAGDYGGELVGNPNFVPQLLLPGLAGLLYLLQQEVRYFIKLFAAAIAGAITLFVIISHSRTGYLSLLLMYIALAIELVLQKKYFKQRKLPWHRSALLVVIALAMAGFSFFCVTTMKQNCIAQIPNGPWWPPVPEELQASLEEIYAVEKSFSDNKLLVKLNSVSSRRISIWIWYVSQLEIMGTANPGLAFLSPHNQYIAIAFRCGIIAGISWLAFCFVSFITGCIEFLKRRPWAFFTINVLIIFMCEAMLDLGIFPMEKLHILIAYFAFAPLFIKSSCNNSNIR